MPSPMPPSADDRLSEEAAEWWMRLQAPDCSDEDRAAFERWCSADPRHLEEFEAVREIWQVSAGLSARVSAPPGIPARLRWRRYAVAASLCAVMVASGWLAGWSGSLLPGRIDYHSGQDARRVVVLPDRSTVELNTGTGLFFAEFRDRRSVILNDGEAFFRVAHDAARPFTVHTDNGSVRVTGTAFNLWTGGKDLVVTLAEGSVEIRPPGSDEGADPLRLTPGMQGRYDSDRRSGGVSPADLEKVFSWRQGKLVLDDLSLKEAVPLLNHYLARPLRLGDETVAGMRIGGIYNVADIDGLVESLPRALPLTVRYQEDAIVLHRR